jgi:hypothetical protein
MKLGGIGIDSAMSPKDMQNKDATELFNAVANILAIPGMLLDE